MTILSDAYFFKTLALARGIEKFGDCTEKKEKERQLKIVGRLLALYEAQIVADLIDQQLLDEVEKYGKEEFERANGYAYEAKVSRPAPSREPEEVRQGQGESGWPE